MQGCELGLPPPPTHAPALLGTDSGGPAAPTSTRQAAGPFTFLLDRSLECQNLPDRHSFLRHVLRLVPAHSLTPTLALTPAVPHSSNKHPRSPCSAGPWTARRMCRGKRDGLASRAQRGRSGDSKYSRRAAHRGSAGLGLCRSLESRFTENLLPFIRHPPASGVSVH